MKHLYKCYICNAYTLKQVCQKCGSANKKPNPPKYSPEDKFGAYRRRAKKLIN